MLLSQDRPHQVGLGFEEKPADLVRVEVQGDVEGGRWFGCLQEPLLKRVHDRYVRITDVGLKCKALIPFASNWKQQLMSYNMRNELKLMPKIMRQISRYYITLYSTHRTKENASSFPGLDREYSLTSQGEVTMYG